MCSLLVNPLLLMLSRFLKQNQGAFDTSCLVDIDTKRRIILRSSFKPPLNPTFMPIFDRTGDFSRSGANSL